MVVRCQPAYSCATWSARARARTARGIVARPMAIRTSVAKTVLEGGRSVTSRVASIAPCVGGIPGEALGLTHRQADVLRLLLQGKPNKLICRDLRLSEGTVKVHVSAILKALNVRSRAQAIAELSRRGVVIDGASHADTH